MSWELAVPGARFTFMVGKGGVGKTTTAALLGLAWAHGGRRVHTLSTDPAHSLGDVFGLAVPPAATSSACLPNLTLEQLAAEARAERWRERLQSPFSELLERGSYLDREDIARFTSLRIPGVDELMAALRLVELVDSTFDHILVDTAPTGHTLRLLDAGALLESWSDVLAALAAKADAVAGALFRGAVESAGAALREELAADLERFRRDVLSAADFIVVTREGEAVRLETGRLGAALTARALRVRATVQVGGGGAPAGVLRVPWFSSAPRGCAALEAALAHLSGAGPPQSAGAAEPKPHRVGAGSGSAWLRARRERLLIFAGKGGVGKSTCAAAAAAVLAETRPVLLLSADPAGSLGDLLGLEVGGEPVVVTPQLRAQQIDAAASLERWRGDARAALEPMLERLGLGSDPVLDRRVFESLWDLAPPGMDEIVALAELLDAVADEEMVVLDTAPTGHFLRLLALPALALEWTRALMRLLLKYGVTAELDAVTKHVIAFARQLRELQARLTDPGWTGTVVVTLPEPVVEAETARLLRALGDADVAVAAILTNHVAAMPGATPQGPVPLLNVPSVLPAPRGLEGLLGFAAHWELQ